VAATPFRALEMYVQSVSRETFVRTSVSRETLYLHKYAYKPYNFYALEGRPLLHGKGAIGKRRDAITPAPCKERKERGKPVPSIIDHCVCNTHVSFKSFVPPSPPNTMVS
jgi:hypothetical protein